jgi:hypothetical protein
MGSKVQQPINQVDFFTGYPVVIQGDHAYIHQGLGYNLSRDTGSLAANAVYVVSLRTPENTSYIHLRPTGLSSTANTMQMRIAEGSTVTGGSAGTPLNRNRNNSRPCLCTVGLGVTLSAEGTVLQVAQVGAGTNAGNASGGGNDGSAEEWVLKPNTTYSIRFQNVGATTATTGYFNLFWYEEKAGS